MDNTLDDPEFSKATTDNKLRAHTPPWNERIGTSILCFPFWPGIGTEIEWVSIPSDGAYARRRVSIVHHKELGTILSPTLKHDEQDMAFKAMRQCLGCWLTAISRSGKSNLILQQAQPCINQKV